MKQRQYLSSNGPQVQEKCSLTRRRWLRGVGTLIAVPWLESLAVAAPCTHLTPGQMTSLGDPPTRLAFMYVPNGMHMSHWTPRGVAEVGFESTPIFEAVKNHLSDTTIISGLALSGAEAHGDGPGDHARSVAAFLTGAHPKKTRGSNIYNGTSIDQVIAQQIGHLTRFPSVELGTESSARAGRCDSGYSCAYTSNISWRTPTSPLPKEMDPAVVFDRLFGGPEQAENQLAKRNRIRKRKSILDFVMQDAKTLHSSLSVQDQRKFDEYLFAVRDVEKRLASADKLDVPETDLSDFQRPLGVPASYGEHVKLMFDLIALAFQTDATRVISFMFANAGSNRSYREIGVRGGHHDLSHHGNAMAKQLQIAQINFYHMQLFSYLLDRLSAIQEGDASLLDHCLIVYGSGISDGNRHNHDDLPIALFGGRNCGVIPGRHIRARVGTPLTNLYCSLADRAGATIDQFSDSNGRIDEL